MKKKTSSAALKDFCNFGSKIFRETWRWVKIADVTLS